MATLATPPPTDWTAADLLDRFGPIPLRRIRQDPAPGTATEQDVIAIHDREQRLFELVDGVLVEQATGVQESYLAILIARCLAEIAVRDDRGMVLGADGLARLAPGLVRIPNVSFIAWERLPGRRVPADPILGLAPDLAVEVLSPSNTAEEMERKLRDYFDAHVRVVWYVDPATKTIRVYSAPDQLILLQESQILEGGDVLPGLAIPIGTLFARLG